jgi:hypothetical protein
MPMIMLSAREVRAVLLPLGGCIPQHRASSFASRAPERERPHAVTIAPCSKRPASPWALVASAQSRLHARRIVVRPGVT